MPDVLLTMKEDRAVQCSLSSAPDLSRCRFSSKGSFSASMSCRASASTAAGHRNAAGGEMKGNDARTAVNGTFEDTLPSRCTGKELEDAAAEMAT
ncbi:MAG: hypothetical protein MZV63_11570 [Marinilabiliales bacterium]|nr:hypothetical protein [Marinilabiliales bacterium]